MAGTDGIARALRELRQEPNEERGAIFRLIRAAFQQIVKLLILAKNALE